MSQNHYIKKFIILLIISVGINCKSKIFYKFMLPEFMINRIFKDLNFFQRTGITQKKLEETVKKDHFFVRCQIINQKINIVYATFLNSISNEFVYLAAKDRLNIFLDQISDFLKKINVPNVDFIISLSDGFIGNSHLYNLDSPVFTFSKWDIDEKLVLIPDIEMLEQCDYYIQAIKKANKLYRWDKKIDKLIWRGLPTGNHLDYCFKDNQRFKAVEISKIYPDLIDAKYSQILPYVQNNFREIIVKNGYLGSSMTLNEQVQYKYQLYIDGWTNSYSRAFWQLMSNCVMLKPYSNSIQWYYDGLVADVHYVLIDRNLSDLKDKIEFLKNNQLFAKNITRSANEFSAKYLNKQTMYGYIKRLFEEYAKLQKFHL